MLLKQMRAWAGAAVAILVIITDVQVASAGVILVSQNRYTREWSRQTSLINGSILSQSDTTMPASGFLPFNDASGRATQASTISTTGFSATGSASASALVGTSTTSWTAGDSQFQVVFDVVDEPIGFHLTNTSDLFILNRRSITGPGGAVFQIPLNGTLDGAFAPGRWTFLLGALSSGEGLGSGNFSQTYDMSMNFIPEPATVTAALIALAAPLVVRRRRRRT